MKRFIEYVIVCFFSHNRMYNNIVQGKISDSNKKNKIENKLFDEQGVVIILKFILSYDYMVSKMFKINLQAITDIDDMKEEKSKLLIAFNHVNLKNSLVISVLIIVLNIFEINTYFGDAINEFIFSFLFFRNLFYFI